MNFETRPCSELGKQIKTRLMNMNKTQLWLINELKLRLPKAYIDGSLLYKIIVGDVTSGQTVDEIKKILNIEQKET